MKISTSTTQVKTAAAQKECSTLPMIGHNELTESLCKALTSSGQIRKSYGDGNNLYLWVYKTGQKTWYYEYTVKLGKNRPKTRRLKLGEYSPSRVLTVAQARALAVQYSALRAQGRDPVQYVEGVREEQEVKDQERERTLQSMSQTVRVVATEWLDSGDHEVQEEGTRKHVEAQFKNFLFPELGDRPIASISAKDIKSMLRKATTSPSSGISTDRAYRLMQRCREIWKWARKHDIVTINAMLDVESDFIKKAKHGHRAALLNPAEVGKYLYVAERYRGWIVVRYALQLLPILFLRSSELRLAEWSEIDLNEGIWSLPAGRMKMKRPFQVPLPKRAVKLLTDLKALALHPTLVFPSKFQGKRTRDCCRPISPAVFAVCFRKLGYNPSAISAHGFRRTAATLMSSKLKISPTFTEACLAHVPNVVYGETYYSSDYYEERIPVMEQWSQYLETLKEDYIRTLAAVATVNQADPNVAWPLYKEQFEGRLPARMA